MSNIRVKRAFFGGYEPNHLKLKAMNYSVQKLMKPRMMSITPDQGLGQVKGATKKLGNNYSPVPVCCFKKSTRQLLWETKSKADGSYAFRNIAVDLECFVIAFDPDNQYNAVIQDKVIAK